MKRILPLLFYWSQKHAVWMNDDDKYDSNKWKYLVKCMVAHKRRHKLKWLFKKWDSYYEYIWIDIRDIIAATEEINDVITWMLSHTSMNALNFRKNRVIKMFDKKLDRLRSAVNIDIKKKIQRAKMDRVRGQKKIELSLVKNWIDNRTQMDSIFRFPEAREKKIKLYEEMQEKYFPTYKKEFDRDIFDKGLDFLKQMQKW